MDRRVLFRKRTHSSAYKEAARFNVVSGIEDMGVARIEHTWKNC